MAYKSVRLKTANSCQKYANLSNIQAFWGTFFGGGENWKVKSKLRNEMEIRKGFSFFFWLKQ